MMIFPEDFLTQVRRLFLRYDVEGFVKLPWDYDYHHQKLRLRDPDPASPAAVCPEILIFPKWESHPSRRNIMVFQGLRVSVTVPAAGMMPHSVEWLIHSADEINEGLVEKCKKALVSLGKLCAHKNSEKISQQGSYSEYSCKDCGKKYVIDSGD